MKRPADKNTKPKPDKRTLAKVGNRMIGRPSLYSVELTDEICRRLYESEGDKLPESLRAICQDPTMPSRQTVADWLVAHEDFSDRYARARQLRKDALVDRLMSLSREAKTAAYGEAGTGVAGARVAAYKIEIDSLKWILSKEYSRDYGDKVTTEISGPDGKPIQSQSSHEISPELQEAILSRASDAARIASGVSAPASFRGVEIDA